MKADSLIAAGLISMLVPFMLVSWLFLPIVGEAEHMPEVVVLGLAGLLYPFAKGAQAIAMVTARRYLIGCAFIGALAGIGAPIAATMF